jgi:hypothetical protein
MSDIFVSYASEDRAAAQKLAKALEARGWSIFWDRTIPTGKTWRETIGKELGSARCVVVLWSKTSVDSDFVLDEAGAAKARRVLLPVRIDDVELPFGFGSIQTADLVNWNSTRVTPELNRLTADIAALIGAPSEEPKEPAGPVHAVTAPSTEEIEKSKAPDKVDLGFGNVFYYVGGALLVLYILGQCSSNEWAAILWLRKWRPPYIASEAGNIGHVQREMSFG